MLRSDDTGLTEVADLPAIPGLRLRRPRHDDADFEARAELLAASNRYDGIPYAPAATNLREEFEAALRYDPAQDIVIAEVDGRPVGEAGSERVVRDGAAVYELYGHVDPAWRRRGLGQALLAWNLERATARAQAEPADVPIAARSFAAESEVAHQRLLEAAGFEPIRWFFEMRRDGLDDVPDVPIPDGLEIRPVSPDQHRAIWEADVEAFQDHWQPRVQTEADFVDLFAKEDLDTALWVVAWDGDEVAGSVQAWIWRGENEQLGVKRGWLEHISVRRPWRRRGLGKALTAAALRRLADAGMDDAMLGVDADSPTGALGLYESLGFVVDQRSIAWRRPLERA